MSHGMHPSKRFASIHERHGQTRLTDKRSDSIGRTVLQTVAQLCIVSITCPDCACVIRSHTEDGFGEFGEFGVKN